MSSVKWLGIILIVVGALALAYGGFTYTEKTHKADLGPITLAVDEKERVNIPVWLGVVMVIGGGVLLLGVRRR